MENDSILTRIGSVQVIAIGVTITGTLRILLGWLDSGRIIVIDKFTLCDFVRDSDFLLDKTPERTTIGCSNFL